MMQFYVEADASLGDTPYRFRVKSTEGGEVPDGPFGKSTADNIAARLNREIEERAAGRSRSGTFHGPLFCLSNALFLQYLGRNTYTTHCYSLFEDQDVAERLRLHLVAQKKLETQELQYTKAGKLNVVPKQRETGHVR